MIKKLIYIIRRRSGASGLLSHLTQDTRPDVSEEKIQDLHDCLDGRPAESVASDYNEYVWNMACELEKDEDIQGLIEEYQLDIQKAKPRRLWNISWGWQTWMKPIGVGALVAATLFFSPIGNVTAPDALLYETQIGTQKNVTLADRSSISLNTDTLVRVIYSETARDIFMDRGEAIFSVEPDKARPFNVHVGDTVVQAIGTEFNIMVDNDDAQRITVSVLEGKVTIHDGDENNTKTVVPVLEAGKAISLVDRYNVTAHQKVNMERIVGWRTGQIVFRNVALVEAVKDHNRYSNIKIILEDESLKTQHISGTFTIGDTDALLFALENLFEIDVDKRKAELRIKSNAT